MLLTDVVTNDIDVVVSTDVDIFALLTFPWTTNIQLVIFLLKQCKVLNTFTHINTYLLIALLYTCM